MEELFALMMTRVFIAILIAGAATLVICFLLNALVMPFTRLKGVKKAEEEGRSVTAVLIKAITPYVVDPTESGIHTSTDGIYQYEVNGRIYRYKGHYDVIPPTEEKLYYRKDPSKARTSVEYGRIESEWKFILIALGAIAFVATFFFF